MKNLRWQLTKVRSFFSLVILVVLLGLVSSGCFAQKDNAQQGSHQEQNTGKTNLEAGIFNDEKLKEAIYIASWVENKVTVLDPKSLEIAAIITVENQPVSQVADPKGKYVYVSKAQEKSIDVLDTSTYKIVKTLKVNHRPVMMDISSDGRKLYVGNMDSNKVSIVDTSDKAKAKTLTTGAVPYQLKLFQDRLLYVFNYGDNSMSQIDLTKEQELNNWKVTEGPSGLVLMPDGEKAYLGAHGANMEATELWYFDLKKGQKISSIKLDKMPSAMALTPDAKRLFVLTHGADRVYVLDTATNKIITSFVAGKNPQDIVFSSDGKRAYIANTDANTVSIVDTATFKEIKEIKVPTAPLSLALVKRK